MDNTIHQNFSVMVVDDMALYRSYAKNILEDYDYTVYLAESGEQALEMLTTIRPDVIMMDVIMTGINGYETFAKILENPQTKDIPVVFLTAETETKNELEGFSMGAADYIFKPFVPEIMLKRIERVIELHRLQENLEEQVREKSAELEQITLQIISAIAATIDAKDRYTKGHSAKVAKICIEIAKELGYSHDKQVELYTFALLHDIGKIGIPDLILNKPTKLTNEEYEIIKSHTTVGSNILKEITILPQACEAARWHHERYDGSGYPDGISGSDIPIPARIICIADAYDAMASKRPYRSVLSKQEIMEEFRKGRGSQFDPTLTDIMLDLIDRDVIESAEDENFNIPTGSFASESNLLLHQLYSKNLEETGTSIALDTLTQTYSRSYFEMQMNDLLKSKDTEGFLVVCNLRKLNEVNNAYGTIVGENLLISLADLIRYGIREDDLVGRLDANEFGIFLRGDLTPATVKTKAKEFLAKFSEEKSLLDYNDISSIAFGAARVFAGENGENYDQLLLQARAAASSVSKKKNSYYALYQDIVSKSKVKATRKLETTLEEIIRYIEQRSNGAAPEDILSSDEISYQIMHEISKDSSIEPRMILLSITTNDDEIDDRDYIESMGQLKSAIKLSLRHGDFDMQYDEYSYLLVVTNVSDEQLETILGRIDGYFQKLVKSRSIEIIYTAKSV